MTSPTPRRRARARSAATPAGATVHLWGQLVGAVALDPETRLPIFEYDPEFRTRGIEISPLRLPLNVSGPQRFPGLARSPAFEGLPGVLADCLPDAFGNAILRRHFESTGRSERDFSAVQKLLYIGRRAMGALEFEPPEEGRRADWAEEALALQTLVDQARKVIEGDERVAIPEIMQVGASAGGARAKALILWNRALKRVRSGFATPESGDEPWLIKFDGVSKGGGGHDLAGEFTPGPYGRIEYVYSRMAKTAGVTMEETDLLCDREFAHFVTRRFDRPVINGVPQRLHMHSLGGLLHVDYNIPRAVSYEDLFRTIRELKLGQPVVDQAYRRMVFNLAARNQDDHVKNIAFLMTPDGRWDLAPAYDLTWAVGTGWTATHQMTAAGKDDDFTRDDLLDIARRFDVVRPERILDDVEEGLALWQPEAEKVGLGAGDIMTRWDLFRRFTS